MINIYQTLLYKQSEDYHLFLDPLVMDVTGTGHWHHDLQFLQLTVLQFLERKNRFREDCSCFLDNANVNRKRYSWQLTVSENEFFVLQITNNR